MVHVAQVWRSLLRDGGHANRPGLAALLAPTSLHLTDMPLGTRHEVAGTLLRYGRVKVLRTDEGGTWRLEMGLRQGQRADSLIGLRVRVIGVRDEFDLLAVEPIERV